MTNKLLFKRNQLAAVAQPEYELSIEIMTGISAAPTAITI
jgi:hypothetical protein